MLVLSLIIILISLLLLSFKLLKQTRFSETLITQENRKIIFTKDDDFFQKFLISSLVNIHIICLLLIFSLFLGNESLIDIALIYALTSFIASLMLPNLVGIIRVPNSHIIKGFYDNK